MAKKKVVLETFWVMTCTITEKKNNIRKKDIVAHGSRDFYGGSPLLFEKL